MPHDSRIYPDDIAPLRSSRAPRGNSIHTCPAAVVPRGARDLHELRNYNSIIVGKDVACSRAERENYGYGNNCHTCPTVVVPRGARDLHELRNYNSIIAGKDVACSRAERENYGYGNNCHTCPTVVVPRGARDLHEMRQNAIPTK